MLDAAAIALISVSLPTAALATGVTEEVEAKVQAVAVSPPASAVVASLPASTPAPAAAAAVAAASAALVAAAAAELPAEFAASAFPERPHLSLFLVSPHSVSHHATVVTRHMLCQAAGVALIAFSVVAVDATLVSIRAAVIAVGVVETLLVVARLKDEFTFIPVAVHIVPNNKKQNTRGEHDINNSNSRIE